jgi:hypothetical protein
MMTQMAGRAAGAGAAAAAAVAAIPLLTASGDDHRHHHHHHHHHQHVLPSGQPQSCCCDVPVALTTTTTTTTTTGLQQQQRQQRRREQQQQQQQQQPVLAFSPGGSGVLPSSSTHPLAERLRGIVGAEHVLSPGDAAQRPFLKGARLGQGAALAVARPGTLQEAVDTLRACVAAGAVVIPQGVSGRSRTRSRTRRI